MLAFNQDICREMIKYAETLQLHCVMGLMMNSSAWGHGANYFWNSRCKANLHIPQIYLLSSWFLSTAPFRFLSISSCNQLVQLSPLFRQGFLARICLRPSQCIIPRESRFLPHRSSLISFQALLCVNLCAMVVVSSISRLGSTTSVNRKNNEQ